MCWFKKRKKKCVLTTEGELKIILNRKFRLIGISGNVRKIFKEPMLASRMDLTDDQIKMCANLYLHLVETKYNFDNELVCKNIFDDIEYVTNDVVSSN